MDDAQTAFHNQQQTVAAQYRQLQQVWFTEIACRAALRAALVPVAQCVEEVARYERRQMAMRARAKRRAVVVMGLSTVALVLFSLAGCLALTANLL
jgi:hypothetical protein